MSTIQKRLRASIKLDAVNGNSMERTVCEKQMLEAAIRIEGLERRNEELEKESAELRRLLTDSCCHSHGEGWSEHCAWCVDTLKMLVGDV